MALLGLYVVIENSTLWVRNIVKQQTFYFLVGERKAFIISVVVSSRLQKQVRSIVQLLRLELCDVELCDVDSIYSL